MKPQRHLPEASARAGKGASAPAPRELAPEEKRLIERELIAREAARAKRRVFAHRVFCVGMTAGGAAAVLRGLVAALLHLIWFASLIIYVGGHISPISWAKDMDPRWHLNPWHDALRNLSEGRTVTQAIALLVGPTLIGMIVSLVFLGIRGTS